MPDNNTHEIMFDVVNKVFGEGAFIFIDPMNDTEIPQDDDWSPVGVGINFSGHREGNMTLWCEESFLCLAAANLLGQEVDSPDAHEKGKDAIKELLNMTTGNLLTNLFGSQPVFDLGLPYEIDENQVWEQSTECNELWVDAEGHAILIRLKLEK